MRRLEILHFSDVHLGVESYSRIDPATGLPSRLRDCLDALDEVVDLAIAERVDLVLFTGDMYKSRDPSPTHQRELAKRIARLIRAGIPLFMLVGNHDLPNSPVRAHAIEVFETLALDRVYVAGRPGRHLIETPSGPIQVVALPWVPRSRLIRHEEAKNLTLSELNQRIVEMVTAIVQGYAVELDPSLPAILAIHGQVYGAEYGSERSTTLGQDYVLSLGDLALDRFDYVALGHIHKMQKVRDRPLAVYAGSLQRTDFGEEREEKGFVRLTISPDPVGERPFCVEWRFVPVRASRPFFTLEVDASTSDDPTALVLNQIERNAEHIRNAVVRLRVKLTSDNESQFRVADVRRALSDAHYVAAIAREVTRHHRRRVPDALAEQLSPLEALELYLKSKNVDEGRRAILLEHASRLIDGGGVA
ncbi:MAG: nuclease SbcCD subunit D [Dehalococcoidia bacterium]|nr:MAG: nuclease SbcCD subunit D [Dehalococcoidia bacterium]